MNTTPVPSDPGDRAAADIRRGESHALLLGGALLHGRRRVRGAGALAFFFEASLTTVQPWRCTNSWATSFSISSACSNDSA